MGRFESAEQVWALYEEGKSHHRMHNLYSDTEQAYRFYEGDQWHGCESGGEKLPFYNIIRPTVNYLAATIAKNNMQICYNPDDQGAQAVCEALNGLARRRWEHTKMESKCWDIIKDACIAGDAYIYFYDEKHAQIIDNTDIHLADESSADLQGQEYIIIRERRYVRDVQEIARQNGLSEDMVGLIIPDDNDQSTTVSTVSKQEKDTSNRCESLIVLHKEDGVVHVLRCTKAVIYQPDMAIKAEKDDKVAAMHLYPVAGLVWGRQKGSARGRGECKGMIANQIEINRMLYRRSVAVKMCAFGKPVYKEGAIDHPEQLNEPGTAISVQDDLSASRVTDIVSYLNPVSMSQDAHSLAEELMANTRQLANAGDAATGNINPEQASGAAIIAVRDQATIPLNEQAASYRQFVEDIALIWADLWAAYNQGGIPVDSEDGMLIITPEDIRAAAEYIRVDVSPTDGYSKFAQEQALQNALAGQHITFAEYVEALPQDAVAPKAKFAEVLAARQDDEQKLQQAFLEGYQQAAEEAMGGMQDVMSEMQA